MNILGKILVTTLPIVFFFLFSSVGTAYYFSRQAITELAETWLKTRLSEAVKIAADQNDLLHTYGLADIPASIAKAKLDAGTMVSAIEVGKHGYIVAVDVNGVVAIHPDQASIGKSVRGEPWFQSLKPGPGRIVYQAGAEKNLAIYDYFTPWQWYILAADPESEVYGSANRMKPYVFYLGLFCAMAMSAALMLLTRRLTEPLRALTRGAESIGSGDLETRITIDSRDEIGRLGEVFNQMTSRLKESLITLQHQEEHFRALIENASDLVTILDANGDVVYQSPSIERILGYTRDGLIGESVFDFVHPDDKTKFVKLFKQQLKTPGTWASVEWRISHKDGSWCTLEATSKNLLDHPAVHGIVVNSRDVTKRKVAEAALHEYQLELEHRVAERTAELLRANTRLREEIDEREHAEKALRASEHRMKGILRASPVGIALVINRRLDWANETLYRMVDYAPGTLVGQDVEILYPDYGEYERVGRVLYTKSTQWEIAKAETRLVRSDGTLFDCVIRAYPLDPAAPTDGLIIALSDVSEAKRLEAELQHAKKMEAVGTLAGGVAHDLNNILSGIVSYPELLLLELPEDSPLRKPILTIQRSGERAAAIVQDLLTMARRGVAIVDVIDVNEILSDQLKSPEFDQLLSFAPLVSIDVHLASDLPPIKGSAAHLSKCFMNLLSNAAEAMPSGGTITIETQYVTLDRRITGNERLGHGHYVAVSVSDTGVGISEGDKGRIFEPFYTKKKMGRSGSGLGMAVVWGTVKDHKGHIDIDSEEGRGSTFTLYFPTTGDLLPRNGQPFLIEKYQGNRERVLVVDDSDVQREIAKRVLEKLGYTVSMVTSGEEAVEYVKNNPVDLLVLDMIMPTGMDGLEAYQKIIEINPAQKAIIASGYSETARVRAAQELGAGRYIRKPYSIETIGVAVKEALEGNGAVSGHTAMT
ncbi:MAG: PAS domain S-box protein [Pseudomonadota bacterium]